LESSEGLQLLLWVEEREERVRRANGCGEEDDGEFSPLMVDDGGAWGEICHGRCGPSLMGSG
jgi:hypothetical protein